MADEAARVIATPSDQAAYLAHDLNLPGTPSGELIVSIPGWRGCETPPGDLPAREGSCCVGLDLGAHRSFTSAAMYWGRSCPPASGRLEVLTACPDTPGLAARARHDAAGALYERAAADGVLWVLSGRLTPVGPFLAKLRAHLAGCAVSGCRVRSVPPCRATAALDRSGARLAACLARQRRPGCRGCRGGRRRVPEGCRGRGAADAAEHHARQRDRSRDGDQGRGRARYRTEAKRRSGAGSIRYRLR